MTEPADLVRAAAPAFRIGDVRAVSPAPGDSSVNLFVSATTGDYVAKILHGGDSLEKRRHEAAFTDAVVAAGLPAVRYLRTVDGNAVHRVGATSVMLLPRAAGESDVRDADSLREAARFLAGLSLLPVDALPAKRGWMTSAVHGEMAARLCVDPSLGTDPEIRRVLAAYGVAGEFRWRTLPHLPRGIIHADLHPGNMLVKDGRLVAALDWEDSSVDAALVDFCISASHFCWTTFAFMPDRFAAFLGAYEEVRVLTDDERAMIGPCMRHVASVQAVWRFLWHHRIAPRESRQWDFRKLWLAGYDAWEPPDLD